MRSRAPVVVTRQGAEPVVMMSLAEFRGWQETVHLLSSPRNAERRLRSIRAAGTGEAGERELLPVGEAPEER